MLNEVKSRLLSGKKILKRSKYLNLINLLHLRNQRNLWSILAMTLIAYFPMQNSARAHVQLDNPLGGETFTEGDTVNIQWQLLIPHTQLNWDLYFSSDSGVIWQPIQLDIPTSQFNYLWIVPNIATQGGQVKIIMDNTGANYQDISGNFQISTLPVVPTKVFIPDTNFRNFLNATYPTFMDISGDSLITDSAATLTGTLDCNNQNIADLTGVEYFINITQLNCSSNQLTVLPDLSANTALQWLYCYNNQLTILPALTNNTALLYLYCYNNQLTTLPALTNNTALLYLFCYSNQLTALSDLSANTALQRLYCYDNQLTALPALTNNTALQGLRCENNQLTALPDLSANTALQWLYCNNNQLTALPNLSANTALQYLWCYNNQLTALPDLSANTALLELKCYNNKLDFSDAKALRIANNLPALSTFIYSPQYPFGDSASYVFCEGDTVALSISSQDSALSYQWFRGTDTIVGATDSILIIPNIMLADSGVYTCRSYGTALLNPPMLFAPGISEFVSEPLIVTINPSPSTPISSSDTACFGDFIPDLTATGTNVRWYNNAGLDTLVNSGSSFATGETAVGTYIYYVTDSLNGCVSPAAMVSLTIKPAPSTPVGSSQTACFGDFIPDLTATGTNLKWYNNAGLDTLVNSGSSFATGETAVGTYIYYVTDSLNGCVSPAAMVSLTINPAPSTPVGSSQTACFGDFIPDLTATGTNLKWYNNAGLDTLVNSGTSFATGETTVGTYTYYVTDSLNNGCVSPAAMVSLTIYPIPSAPPISSIPDTNGTGVGTATISVSGGTPPYTYLWSPSGGSDSVAINLTGGTYTITVTDFNSCTYQDSVTIGNITGIDQLSMSNDQLKIYPNPSTGKFVIEINVGQRENIQIKIVNILGQEVFAEEQTQISGTYHKQIDLKGYAAGVYQLQLITSRKVVIRLINVN